MDFKKKAGLALALAAIFTTGGAGAALADGNVTGSVSGGTVGSDITAVGQGTAFIDDESSLSISGTATTLTAGSGVKIQVDGLAILGDSDDVKGLKKVAIAADSTEGVQFAGNGSSLLTVNGQQVETVEISGGDLLLGTDGTTVSNGGSFNNLVTDSGIATTVVGGAFEVQGTFTAGGDILVGQAGSADHASGTLIVNTLNLAGNGLFADPDFSDGVYNPSQVAVEKFITADPSKAYINGGVTAGNNSTITIGSKSNALINSIIANTERWGNQPSSVADQFTGAMLIVGPQVLNVENGLSGVLEIDDQAVAATTGANTASVTAADKSLLAFDLTGVGGNVAALSAKDNVGAAAAITSVTIGTGSNGDYSAIYFHNAKVGDATIFADVNTISTQGTGTFGSTTTTSQSEAILGDHWTGENLMFSSELLTGAWKGAAGANSGTNMVLEVSRSNVAVKTLFPKLSSGMAKMVDAIYTNGDSDAYQANAGLRFVTRVTDNDFIGKKDPTLAAKVLEGAGQIAVAAGVPTITNNVVGKVSSLILDHANLLNETQPAYGNEPGMFGIWATPFYQYSDVDGMDAGKFDNGYEINYGGAAIGLDYNVNEAFRLGLALSIGGGDSESQGDFLKTENDFDFFGVSLYGTYTDGAFGLTGDIGYTAIDNEIEQRIPTALGFGSKLKADADSDAFTVGLTGQYRFTASESMNITPHLGLRYTKISTDDATVKGDRAKLFRVDTDDQNLFQIPLGVTFSGDIETSRGWTVTPSADLGVLFTMGDTDVDSKARVIGTGYSGVTNADVVDSAAFTGKLGIKAASDNGLTLGLDYGILASGNQTDHSVSGLLRFEF